MTLRILMAGDFYPPFKGGLERQAHLLSTELARRGHQVNVVTVWHRGLATEEDDSGVAVHRVKGLTTAVPWFSTVPGRRYHPPFPDPGIVWHLRRLIRRLEPDVVHAHGWIGYSCAAALLGLPIPLVVSAHDYGYGCAVRVLLRRGQVCDGPGLRKCLACAARTQGSVKGLAAVLGIFAGRRLLRSRLAALHSVSSFVDQFHRRYLLNVGGGRGDQRGVIIPDIGPTVNAPPLPLPRGEGSPSPRGSGQLPAEPFILFVGGLTAAKGLDPLLAAYQRLSSRPPLVLIGTVWPDTPSTFPAGVTVLQNVPNTEVMDAWARALFGVQPSLCPETFGVAVVEGMAHAKAIVATRVGGMVDLVVDGQTGILVPPADVTALAQAMQRLVDDPGLRARFGHAGQARAQLFEAAAIVPQFETLYTRMVNGRARAGATHHAGARPT